MRRQNIYEIFLYTEYLNQKINLQTTFRCSKAIYQKPYVNISEQIHLRKLKK